jgi:hypothetical protein
MNNSVRLIRTCAAVAAVAALALTVAACTGGSRSSAGTGAAAGTAGPTRSPSAVAYAACMRSHGVPNFPDPDSQGQVAKGDAQYFGVGTAQLAAARAACQDLYPSNGSFEQQTQQCMMTGDCPQALVQQLLTAERKFAVCMRSVGVTDWPDPGTDSEGRPVFPLSTVAGRDRDYWRSPQITSKSDECQRRAPSPVPVG